MSSPQNPIPVLRLKRPEDMDDVEWPIDRNILLEIAPDREALIMDSPSLSDLREAIKINVINADAGHWLSHVQVKRFAALKDSTARVSRRGSITFPFFKRHPSSPDLATSPAPLAPSRIINNTPWASFTRGRSNLSPEKLVSPRALGPTHLLALYAEPPSPQGVYPLVVELPINDLAFVVNCPNLHVPWVHHPRALPQRRGDPVLPRVLLHVRALEAWAELIVFMHTKNQAALFRALLPRWIHDLIYPLLVGAQSEPPADTQPPVRMRVLSLTRADMKAEVQAQAEVQVRLDTQRDAEERVARELAQLASVSELKEALDKIVAVRENLADVGLQVPSLSRELDFTHEILLRAEHNQANLSLSASPP